MRVRVRLCVGRIRFTNTGSPSRSTSGNSCWIRTSRRDFHRLTHNAHHIDHEDNLDLQDPQDDGSALILEKILNDPVKLHLYLRIIHRDRLLICRKLVGLEVIFSLYKEVVAVSEALMSVDADSARVTRRALQSSRRRLILLERSLTPPGLPLPILPLVVHTGW